MKSVLLGSVALFVLGACSCENKTPTPPAAENPPAQVAAGEANPATPPPSADSGAPPTPAPSAPSPPAVDGEATLAAPLTATAGANMDVGWTGPGNGGDYIDVVPRDFANTSGEVSYAYVRLSKDGKLVVRAPTAPGEYDIRYVQDLSGKRTVKAKSPLTVNAAVVKLTVPASVTAGQALAIQWTGPNGQGDYIDIVKAGHTQTSGEIAYAYTNLGNPAKLEAPSTAGAYLIRYVLEGPGGRKVPATTPLAVAAAKATLDAPASVTKGTKVKVTWTGPDSTGDYVDLVKKGYAETRGELSYFYTSNRTAELTAPQETGEYEIRYVLEAPGGRAVLVRRAITVR